MVGTRQQGHSPDNVQRGQEGNGSGASSLGDRIAEALEHLAEQAHEQSKRRVIFTSTFTASLGQGPGALFVGGVHLPEEAAIASAYIENGGTASVITVYEGGGGAGRVLSTIPFGFFKRLAVPDYISSLSLVTNVTDTGLCVVTLTTRSWSPATGAL